MPEILPLFFCCMRASRTFPRLRLEDRELLASSTFCLISLTTSLVSLSIFISSPSSPSSCRGGKKGGREEQLKEKLTLMTPSTGQKYATDVVSTAGIVVVSTEVAYFYRCKMSHVNAALTKYHLKTMLVLPS